MPDIAPELWMLFPLALAAGIDLYLTLLVVGAAPGTSWWDLRHPGALGDLDAPAILIVVGLIYLIEFTAERRPASLLVWNAIHALIRPVSGALLGVLLLHGQPPALVFAGGIAAGCVAALAHAVRTGGAILRWLDPARDPDPLLVSMLEDTLVLGLVSVALDAPEAGLAASFVVAWIGSRHAGSRVRAFVFAVRLAGALVFQRIRRRSWTPTEALPSWVRSSLEDDVMAPGGGLRGARAAVLRMRGLPWLATGWVVIRGDDPAFVRAPRGRSGTRHELGHLRAVEIEDHDFFRRLDLRDEEDRPVRFFFFVNGPSASALAAEFGLRAGEPRPGVPDS
jgi:hypothetical protein